ncbi:hypothetical protein [Rhodococcus sp. NPDC057529]|uniref:hypothetical protein n=1 Tax=Rhodococcus sp. NPDC057529 TaxID=3346158 RepID=UPI0036710365
MPDEVMNGASAPSIAVGAYVQIRCDGERLVCGVIVEDFAISNPADPHDRKWAPVGRWAVALDDGRLVFVDTENLVTAHAEWP